MKAQHGRMAFAAVGFTKGLRNRSAPDVAESIMATNGYGADPTVKRLQFSNPYINFLGTTTPSGTAAFFDIAPSSTFGPQVG